MVTGDHPATAAAIAKSVGVVGLDRELVKVGAAGLPGGEVRSNDSMHYRLNRYLLHVFKSCLVS